MSQSLWLQVPRRQCVTETTGFIISLSWHKSLPISSTRQGITRPFSLPQVLSVVSESSLTDGREKSICFFHQNLTPADCPQVRLHDLGFLSYCGLREQVLQFALTLSCQYTDVTQNNEKHALKSQSHRILQARAQCKPAAASQESGPSPVSEQGQYHGQETFHFPS